MFKGFLVILIFVLFGALVVFFDTGSLLKEYSSYSNSDQQYSSKIESLMADTLPSEESEGYSANFEIASKGFSSDRKQSIDSYSTKLSGSLSVISEQDSKERKLGRVTLKEVIVGSENLGVLDISFGFKSDSAGAISDFKFEDSVSQGSRNLIYQILNYTQFLVPDSTTDAWEAYEHDSYGSYRAEYTKNGSHLSKNKFGYLSIYGNGSIIPSIKLSEAKKVLNNGNTERISGLENIEIKISGGYGDIFIETVYDFSFGSFPNLLDLMKLIEEKRNIDIDFEKNPEIPVVGVKEGLDYLAQLLIDGKDENIKYSMVMSFVEKNKDDLLNAIDMLEFSDDYPDLLGLMFFAALADTGTEYSQKALIYAAVNGELLSTKTRAILSFQAIENPIREVIDTSQAIYSENKGELHNMAALAYGTVGGKSDEYKDEVQKFLNDRLQNTSTADETGLILDALGNSGYYEGFDEYIASENISIYLPAFEAVVKNETDFETKISYLENEIDDDKKSELIIAMSHLDEVMEYNSWLIKNVDIMHEGSQVKSTISAISVIGGNVENNEANQKLISQFASEDYPDEIRKEAYKYLSIN